ncbi:DUF6323 family protein [Anaeromicropila herbilytica]|uniref:Uncharacterized protein n=1 Tax=Anaeromicropila herbilytica TaxID=2785025 RepID=A0A7R7EL81_9FIRM|nr:DUF6323 family protein [Anaeromicropila herbilytica]BCN30650.1 hypothetical protein bsdtb5_19450 [Anaeromicropila herbilytica]
MDDNKIWSLIQIQQKNEIQKVIECNEYTKKYGVILSEKDVIELYHSRKDALIEQERIELGGSILPKLIFQFCDSAYIYQDNYLEMLEGLQDIFYLYKNESLDELTDDELLEYMKEHFEEECQGSLDYLADTCLEDYCRNLREGNLRIHINRGEYEDD